MYKQSYCHRKLTYPSRKLKDITLDLSSSSLRCIDSANLWVCSIKPCANIKKQKTLKTKYRKSLTPSSHFWHIQRILVQVCYRKGSDGLSFKQERKRERWVHPLFLVTQYFCPWTSTKPTVSTLLSAMGIQIRTIKIELKKFLKHPYRRHPASSSILTIPSFCSKYSYNKNDGIFYR